jgi:serine protease
VTTPTGRTVRRGTALTLCTGLTMGLIASALVAPAQAADDVVGVQPVPQGRTEVAEQQLAAGVIYKLREGYSATASAKSLSSAGVAAGVAIGTATTAVDADGTKAVDFAEPVPAATAQKAADVVAANPAVEWAEPNYIATTAQAGPVTPEDEYFKQYQWNVWDYRDGSVSGVTIPKGGWSSHALNMWPRTQGGGVVVAVVDTGITSHPDLDPNVVAGYDMISSASIARDGNGRDSNPLDNGDLAGYAGGSTWHGTHVAGIVAAARDTTGMVGVAPNADIQPIRVLGKGGGTFGDIAAGITWASGGSVSGTTANTTPAKVINLSIQTQADLRCPQSLQSAITGARQRGAVVIAAAGNYNKSATLSAPGNCAGVITVGALDRNGKRSSYSNKGASVDLSASGGSGSGTSLSGYVWSTFNAGTTSPGAATWGGMAGTSQAAPAVAGAAALIAGLGVKGSALEQAVQKIVSPFPHYSGSAYNCSTSLCGRGYLDISKALVPLGSAAISGTPAVSKAVRATVPPGFVGKVLKRSYQWYRSGVAIEGATSEWYRVAGADKGKLLKVRVTPVSSGSYWAVPAYSANVQVS